ncbi:hypothetical protein chiPu_0019058 [Chiloscyllium punctatum]|uniref:Ig-like domain-containing protein n=1 Tax=Chiloscyllium punctatum TaxID=137246 RepID=A0A401RQK5_CHIPU|nr:hypothetical protein [Chiloscyllium punctatum]
MMSQIYRVLFLLSSLIYKVEAGEDEVTQLAQWTVVKESENASIECSTTTRFRTVYWYRQFRNQPPQYLVMAKRETDQQDRISASVGTDYKHTVLSVRDTRLNDTAVYLCANGGTVLQTEGESGQKPIPSWRVANQCYYFRAL